MDDGFWNIHFPLKYYTWFDARNSKFQGNKMHKKVFGSPPTNASVSLYQKHWVSQYPNKILQ